jgi:hypothetical protein
VPFTHAFEEMLIKDVIPDIDRNFRTLADRDHRALFLSAGTVGSDLQFHTSAWSTRPTPRESTPRSSNPRTPSTNGGRSGYSAASRRRRSPA